MLRWKQARGLPGKEKNLSVGLFIRASIQGDSGGPFIVADPNRAGRYTLAGLTSWGIGCGAGGVYTRVSAFRSWVESFTGATLS